MTLKLVGPDETTPNANPPSVDPVLVAELEKTLSRAKAGELRGALILTLSTASETELRRVGVLIPATTFHVLEQFRHGVYLDMVLSGRGAP